MAKAPSNPVVDIRMELYQPDQPGSDNPDFVYKPGKFYRVICVKYADGSGQRFQTTEAEIDKTSNQTKWKGQ